jgi:hypothetical protein
MVTDYLLRVASHRASPSGRRDIVPAMIKHSIRHIPCIILACVALAGCATDEVDVTSVESGLLCTPGAQTCDYGCAAQGGPSTNDCIVKCNLSGTAWVTITDCGWAQNFPYSSSCFPSQPRPRCENN